MAEETKEEYLARHRREMGIVRPLDLVEEIPEEKPSVFMEKLKSALFILVFMSFILLVLLAVETMRAN
jgi:hypothetical protein